MTPTTDKLRALAERLEGAVTDWNGERMVDGEPPRETLYCRDLRETASALRQWIAERERADALAMICKDANESAMKHWPCNNPDRNDV